MLELQPITDTGQRIFPFWLAFQARSAFAKSIQNDRTTLERDIIDCLILVPGTAQEVAERLSKPREVVLSALVTLKRAGLVMTVSGDAVGDVECSDCNRDPMKENPVPDVGDRCASFYDFDRSEDADVEDTQCLGTIVDDCSWYYAGSPVGAFYEAWVDINFQ